ncbi:MAG: energy-coupled thiamine transporter ThiT [Ruminococcaceae bacterium]|nr:energy-coupled thiamine transporter ThiT [Oscillospiraceae bacterium]
MAENKKNSAQNSSIRVLVECALMVALAVVIDLIPMPKWPNGGSVSIAAVPIIYIAYRHGLLWGLGSGLVYSVVQMVTGFYPPPTGTFLGYVGVVLLDYVLAFTAFGLADLFAKPFGKRRLIGYGVGAVCVNLLRFVCSFLSGWIIWGSYAPEGQAPWLYSLLYNGGYMLPNAILCAVVIVLLCKFVDPKTLRTMK